MNTIQLFRLGVVLAFLCAPAQILAQGTAFTYQGRLGEPSGPANGTYDFTFRLYDAVSGGSSQGGPLTNSAVTVSDGYFTVTLDFGLNPFSSGAARWVEIAVRTNGGGAFIPLAPRQPVTATPYALTAGHLSSTLPNTGLAGTYSNALNLNNSANIYAGNGAGLTQLNATQLKSGTVDDVRLPASIARTNQVWLLGGNFGTTTGTHFLGTADNQPLEIKVNNQRVLRLDPTAAVTIYSNTVNVIAGSPLNFAAANVFGATIGGGGGDPIYGSASNNVFAHFGTVGGGSGNSIAPGGDSSTIAGGRENQINGTRSFIGGGHGNAIHSTEFATIGGGLYNTIATAFPAAAYATISGGTRNTNASARATISGGDINRIESDAEHATIGGGTGNLIATDSPSATIGGGIFHTVHAAASYAVIAGGYNNTIGTNATVATIMGGQQQNNSAPYATLGGGLLNAIQTNAQYAVIVGGNNNIIHPNGNFGVIPGGQQNTATNFAFAAGRRAKANHTGAFVWADSQSADFVSTTNNQFNIRAGGGARFITGGQGLTVDGLAVLAGTVPSNGLAGNYSSALALTNAGNSFSGNGAGLASLNASQLTSGTVADARLSSNVALRNQNNAFSVSQGVPAGTTTAPALAFNGDANTGWFSPAADTVAVTTGGAERFRVTSGGLLGLGTNNPTARLHIASAGSTPQLHLGQNDSVNAFTRIRFSVGDITLWDLAAGGTANVLNFFNSANGNVMVLSTNGHLRVNSLGVGADSIAANLTVTGDSSQPQLRLQQTTGGAAPRLRMINGNSPYWDMFTAANGDYVRWYSEKTGFNAMTLLDDGTLITTGPVNPPSDRNVKQDFVPVDAVAVLEKVAALPIQSWAYQNSPDVRHIGPVAQDFHAAFQLNGVDDKHISTVDADGVALAAIQGLNQKLETENAELKARLEKLERLVELLAAKR